MTSKHSNLLNKLHGVYNRKKYLVNLFMSLHVYNISLFISTQHIKRLTVNSKLFKKSSLLCVNLIFSAHDSKYSFQDLYFLDAFGNKKTLTNIR